MLLFTKLATPKVPKRRSRSGCVTCKEKKKKCDEERPQCARCVERGSICVYEPVKPRQRRKRTDSFVSSAPSTAATTSTTTTNAVVSAIAEAPDYARPLFQQQRRDSQAQAEVQSPRFRESSTASSFFFSFETEKSSEEWVERVTEQQPLHVLDEPLGEICDAVVLSPLESHFDLGSLVGGFPQQILDPPHHHHHALSGHPHILPPATSLYHSSSSFGLCNTDRIVPEYSHDTNVIDDDDEVEERVDDIFDIHRRSSFASSSSPSTSIIPHYNNNNKSPHNHQTFSPSLAMIAPWPVRSPLLEFSLPVFSEFSDRPNRRALVDHFCNVLSHLIVFREEAGNPFQQLVLPLSRSHPSSPVTNAVFALASAHLEHRGVDTGGEKSLLFHSRAIQGLARLIQTGDSASGGGSGACSRVDVRNETLAAIMLLVYYEVLVQRGRSNIVEGHLKGALTVMCSSPEPLDSTGIFLERAFRFYDVIAALSFGTAPLSTAPAAGCLLPFPPPVVSGIGIGSGNGGTNNISPASASSLKNVDALLGMATTLWPVIHRLSGLLSLRTDLEKAQAEAEAVAASQGQQGHRQRSAAAMSNNTKIAVLRTEFETTASAIEDALSSWTPVLPPGWARDEADPTKLRHLSASASESASTTPPPPPHRRESASEDDTTTTTATGDSPESTTSATTSSTTSSSHASSSTPTPNASSSSSSPTAKQAQETSSRLHSILNNALAYRHSAFVYLYRTIRARPRSHPLVQTHARLSLRHCAATVAHAGPMGALLWPLFVAACEATEEEDRGVAGEAFAALERRQGMTNIERSWEVVREVWRRADGDEFDESDEMGGGGGEREADVAGAGEAEEMRGEERLVEEVGMMMVPPPLMMSSGGGGGHGRKIDLWRRVSEDIGVNIVFG